jgi:Nucleotidyl transferase AbiEii toxin, Type IV TA system
VDFDITKRVLSALERHGVRYAIFGAVALNLHGLARFTADLDLFIEPTPENVERLRAALKGVIDDPAIDEISAHDLLGEYPAIQYNPPDATFHIDILTRLGNAYAFADLQVERMALDELTVSVVTPQTLYEMKRDTVRLKDKADAHALKQRFGLRD